MAKLCYKFCQRHQSIQALLAGACAQSKVFLIVARPHRYVKRIHTPFNRSSIVTALIIVDVLDVESYWHPTGRPVSDFQTRISSTFDMTFKWSTREQLDPMGIWTAKPKLQAATHIGEDVFCSSGTDAHTLLTSFLEKKKPGVLGVLPSVLPLVFRTKNGL